MKKYIICFAVILTAAGLVGTASWYGLTRYCENQQIENMAETHAAAVTAQIQKITSATTLIVESCQTDNADIASETVAMPQTCVGMTREELTAYTAALAEEPDHIQEGLISCDIISFSPEKVVLRKTYQSAGSYSKYYIGLYMGCVTVYYSDRKTVYDYTNISLTDLPPAVRSLVVGGFAVKDDKALYDFLENYSS